MDAAAGQLEEYEKQLADIEALLEATPEDESLLSVKKDLVELVELTRGELKNSPVATEAASAEQEEQQQDTADGAQNDGYAAVAAAALPVAEIAGDTEGFAVGTTETAAAERPKKKSKTVKEFEIPQRLLPAETDTETEANKKKRAIKALKRTHRSQVKEQESNKKQKSWQSFQKKKKVGGTSIFSTGDGESKIGVVTGRKKTSFKERTRHKK
ncbi:expressed unknown protein [Seminavis robusta]|uniref:Uncharacterized protein n=1 Tax=Seminavis robusta TaxID=568900 RepID=A0A9N8DF89_9STRA|nr:expressed unknown protein [Seminavis robusta]|eukprot:Sro90_g047200.1 n/a (213) ;mRNA; r:7706-8344